MLRFDRDSVKNSTTDVPFFIYPPASGEINIYQPGVGSDDAGFNRDDPPSRANYRPTGLKLIHPINGSSYISVGCLLYTSPSPRDQRGSRMPSSA